MNNSAVTATNISLGYDSTIVFTDSSFTIPQGSLTAVIGPNGSGKSTLLNAIANLAKPLKGSIQIHSAKEKAPKLSYVLQTHHLNQALPVTVEEVVTMGRYAGLRLHQRLQDIDRQAVYNAMARTSITEIKHRHIHNLSVGQRQRVFVAQGLAQEHDLLLLDEPLAGIDMPTAKDIDTVIHNERDHGCTVISTTHDLSEARVSDHVLLLAGRVVASGTPQDVLTYENLAAAYGSTLVHGTNGQLFVDDAAHHHTHDH